MGCDRIFIGLKEKELDRLFSVIRKWLNGIPTTALQDA